MRPGFATALLLLLGYGFMATGGPSLMTALDLGLEAGVRHEGASSSFASPVEVEADGPTAKPDATTISTASESPLLRAALDDHSCHHCVPACFEGRGHVCMGAAPSGGELVSMDVAGDASRGAAQGEPNAVVPESPDDPGDRALGGVRIAPRPCRPLDGTPAASTFASLDLRHVTETLFPPIPSGDRERVLHGVAITPESRVESPEAPPPRRA